MNHPIQPPSDHLYDASTPAVGLNVTIDFATVPELAVDDQLRAAATVCGHAAGAGRADRRADALELLDALGLRDLALDRIARRSGA